MSEEEIIKKVDLMNTYGTDFIIFTGGEPLLQLNRKLCDLLHNQGYTIAVESNGTIEHDLPIDWLTISPKHKFTNAKTVVKWCDEVKLLVDEETDFIDLKYLQDTIDANYYYLQPIDTKNDINNGVNTLKAIQFAKENPTWRISLQTQKILNVQ